MARPAGRRPPTRRRADADAGKWPRCCTKGACVSCHGANFSKPIDRSYPKIAGQHADYLFVALKAYKVEGNPQVGRSNAIMAGIGQAVHQRGTEGAGRVHRLAAGRDAHGPAVEVPLKPRGARAVESRTRPMTPSNTAPSYRLRAAEPQDVPAIVGLIRELAEFEKLAHLVQLAAAAPARTSVRRQAGGRVGGRAGRRQRRRLRRCSSPTTRPFLRCRGCTSKTCTCSPRSAAAASATRC